MSFRVVTDRLEALATDMDGLTAALDDVAHRHVAYAGMADVGAVEDALNRFFTCGTDAMGRLHTELAALAEHLHDACSAYDGAEQAIVDAIQGKG